jgi:hypothetical protein
MKSIQHPILLAFSIGVLALTSVRALGSPVGGSANDDTGSIPAPQVSTGVTPPVLVQTDEMRVPTDFALWVPDGSKFILDVDVDETGKAQNVTIIKTANPLLNDRVIQTVQQFRWNPATLDNQPIPYQVDLNFVVSH